jgi:ribosomal protein S8
MSLVNLANVCSHLQNASKARLGLTSIPSTKQNLALALSLQKSGFLSSVTRGGPMPPLLLTPTALPHATDPQAAAEATVTQENVATRRLWVGLKYWKNEPVLSTMKSESKPKKRVMVGFRELERIVRGREAKWVKGLTQPGECLYVSTDRGLMEARDAVERKIGGLVLCRAL